MATARALASAMMLFGPLLGAIVADAFGDAAMLASLGLFLLAAAYSIQRSTADAGLRRGNSS